MSTPAVVMYTTSWCPYCERARKLLATKKRDVRGNRRRIGAREARRDAATAAAGATVPQIFIGDHHVGGSDDLLALEDAGKLDALLGR